MRQAVLRKRALPYKASPGSLVYDPWCPRGYGPTVGALALLSAVDCWWQQGDGMQP